MEGFERSLWIAGRATSVAAFTLVVVIALYALGSFLLMRRHVKARAFGVSMRELLRELVVAIVTQPLIPLYYLLGRRMGRGSGVPVVFVHGYMQNRAGFLGLARALAKRKIGPLYGFNYPWFASLASNAARLEQFIERVCAETRSPVVDVVAHSMGGLVAMEMMRDEARKDRLKVRKCVTIASPHAGVVWRGPIIGVGAASLRRGSKLLEAHAAHKIAVPCLSIFSTHDNIVFPKETSMLAARGGVDLEVEGVAHLAMLFSSRVADEVASFLSAPRPDAV